MPDEYDMALAAPPEVLIEPPADIKQEFSPEYKKARKKFAKMVETKIEEAAQPGMGSEDRMKDARSLIDQLKYLEMQ